MIVSELIEALKKMPQDAKVMLTDCDKGRWDLEVRDVVYNKNVKNRNYAHTVELDNWPAKGF